MEEFTAVCWRGVPRGAVFPRGGKYKLGFLFFVSLFPGPLVFVNAFSADLMSLFPFFL